MMDLEQSVFIQLPLGENNIYLFSAHGSFEVKFEIFIIIIVITISNFTYYYCHST